jgi:hypothetical protein
MIKVFPGANHKTMIKVKPMAPGYQEFNSKWGMKIF